MVILDEGHRLKNDKSKISKAIRGLQTKRRIILTGTPIQNKLEEYWCMVDFVYPEFLGTKKRFNNLFANPIKCGMLADSEMSKVRMGKRRMHVLVKKLAPIVQRRDESILRALLPPKQEFVLYTRLSEIQQCLY
uniref:Helicase ATP-binding domain-containing protein n=1 Tax=Guillardia theta (strain CCMP2712) TaxID=905079 RepID=A0A0C3T210_GUITC